MENPLVRVPVALPVLERANALRRRFEARLRSFDVLDWRDVRYGEDESQVMELWQLDDLGPRDGWPAVLLIHGGGWVEGDLGAFASLGPAFARRGILGAAMGYRLGPAHRWPAQLDDAHAALDRLLAAQVDRERIALWGHSAGGHLALMLALQRPEDIRCVVALGAPTDLAALPGPPEVFDEDQLALASPIHLHPAAPPPMRLIHGSADAVVPIGHARALAAQWPEQAVLDEIPDGDHGIRWPVRAALRARRQALDWVETQLAPEARRSKWKRRRAGKR